MHRTEDGQRVSMTGRQNELRLLGQALEDCARGGAVRFLVTGEPGIGRTSLLRAFSASARAQGCHTIDLVCSLHDRNHPLGLVRQLAAQLTALLPAAHGCRAALDAALASPTGPPDPGAAPDDLLPPVLTALVELTSGASVVLSLDDAHQADTASLDFLRRALLTPHLTRVLLVASVRDGESGGGPGERHELLVGTRHRRLEGLTRAQAAALLRRMLHRTPADGLVAECHRACAGNPFLLTEVARVLRDRPADSPDRAPAAALRPASVAEFIGTRLMRTDPNAGKVATAIALAETNAAASPLLVSHLSGLSLSETLAAVDLLVCMRLVGDSDKLSLRHPVVRDALLGRMTLMARNAAHLAAAAYLHGRQAPAEQIAGHLTASTVTLEDSWPVPVLMRAGQAALAAREPHRARRYLAHAVQAASGEARRAALLQLTDATMAINRVQGIDEAIRTLAETTDDALRLPLLARISTALYLGFQPGEAARTTITAGPTWARLSGWHQVHRMLDSLNAYPLPTAAQLSEERLAPKGHGLGRRTAPAAEFCGAEQAAAAALVMGALRSHLGGGRPAQAVAQAREALRTDTGLCLHPVLKLMALMVLTWNGRDEDVAAHLRRHEDCARCHEHPLHRTLLLPVTARMALLRGRLRDAHDELHECLEAIVRHKTRYQHPLLVWIVGMLAEVQLAMGRGDEARALLREHGCLGSLPPGWLHRDVWITRARLRADSGDLPGAARDLAEALGADTPDGATGGVHSSLHAVDLLTQLGRDAEARDTADRLLRSAEAAGTPRERGIALRALGALPDTPEAGKLLREAIRLLTDAGADFDLAHASADLACLLFDEGRHDEALTQLSTALELADRCGARPLAVRLRQRLAAAEGRSAGRSPLGGVLKLTKREKQILIDAVRGSTNERIATTLHITRRTVELHLSSAYRKLDITGRKDFPHLFRTTGLWPLLVDSAAFG
ncbi:AAA family ATPase [Streptomyces sp. NPDC048612]|uniref:helix-turn-helix transcriptional regulator n=1 Tax=Streptomyces sp. NPDC048612 TaxID=3365579 RepID=UPI00372388E1